MMAEYTTALTIRRGNTFERTITVTQDGAAYNMTGYTLRFVAKEEVTDPDAEAVIDETVAFSAPATGIGTLTLTGDDTNVTPADYIYEFKLYDAAGDLIQTLGYGKLTIADVALLSVT